MEWSRDFLYSASRLHDCKVGLITKIKKVSEYEYEFITEEGTHYQVNMGNNGNITKIISGDRVLYEELPE